MLLTPGAAGALFIVATSLLRPADHLVVLRPNYATNIETPRAIGCAISFVDLTLEKGFRYTADDIAAAMTPCHAAGEHHDAAQSHRHAAAA